MSWRWGSDIVDRQSLSIDGLISRLIWFELTIYLFYGIFKLIVKLQISIYIDGLILSLLIVSLSWWAIFDRLFFSICRLYLYRLTLYHY